MLPSSHHRSPTCGKPLLLAILLPILGGCASYQSLPLEDHPHWTMTVDHLNVDSKQLPFPRLAAYPFNPADGLDMTEIAILAVIGNPDLKLARLDAGIGRAQSFAAGLLPDPQLSVSGDLPVASAPGLVNAYGVGLGFDLQSLWLYGSGREAAQAENHKIDLNLLWQEWQVATQARVLFSRAVSQREQMSWLQQSGRMVHDQYRRSQAALAVGDLTAAQNNANLIAWQDIQRQIDDVQRQQLQTRHDLNALLGLPPQSDLPLRDTPPAPLPDAATLKQEVGRLPQRRPDLLALKAGYLAQDARYRQAILAQFPPLNLGLNLMRDTGGITTHGLALSLTLPLFNGNRGAIAVQKATRERLNAEYENRILAAQAMARRLLDNDRLLTTQLDTLQRSLPQIDAAARRVQEQLDEGDLDEGGFVTSASARIAQHIAEIQLRQSLLENRIALLALLGPDLAQPQPAEGTSP